MEERKVVMTNAEKIRSMTDVELADLFTSKTPFIDGKYSSKHGIYCSENREFCLNEELEWLVAQVSEDQ